MQSMNLLMNPNLPDKNVKHMICDSRVDINIRTELKNLGIKIIEISPSFLLQEPISAHPDIHIFHLGGNRLITSAQIEINNILKEIPDCEIINKVDLETNYPLDVKLNAAYVGEYIICNSKTVCNEILNLGKKIIDVRQGYSKCSVCIISKEAIITDDLSIYNSSKNKIDALLIEHGCVKLNGYNYGFIGGCSGKIAKDKIIFSGSIDKLKCADDIRSFCRNHSVECISLTNNDLYDYGSFLPITEE